MPPLPRWLVLPGVLTVLAISAHASDVSDLHDRFAASLQTIARIASDTASERTHLDACLATEAFASECFILARLRHEDLREETAAGSPQP